MIVDGLWSDFEWTKEHDTLFIQFYEATIPVHREGSFEFFFINAPSPLTTDGVLGWLHKFGTVVEYGDFSIAMVYRPAPIAGVDE